jgi:hypothetical protein
VPVISFKNRGPATGYGDDGYGDGHGVSFLARNTDPRGNLQVKSRQGWAKSDRSFRGLVSAAEGADDLAHPLDADRRGEDRQIDTGGAERHELFPAA